METDSELIAEFMDLEFSEGHYGRECNDHNGHDIGAIFWHTPEGLLYHKSWDWLMPSWFKFQDECKKLLRGGEFTEYHYHEKYFLLGIKQQNIGNCYKALVEGIKWYNTTSPQQ